jgi:hypothetical protein
VGGCLSAMFRAVSGGCCLCRVVGLEVVCGGGLLCVTDFGGWKDFELLPLIARRLLGIGQSNCRMAPADQPHPESGEEDKMTSSFAGRGRPILRYTRAYNCMLPY